MKASAFERAARAHIASRGSAGTRKLYEGDLAAWLAHCAAEGVSPDEPDLAASTSFRDAIVQKYQPSVVRRILSALSSMHEAAGVNNVFNGKRLQRPERDDVALTKEFTENEARALIAAAEAEYLEDESTTALRDSVVLHLMNEHGLRIGTVLGLRRERVLRNGDSITIQVRPKKKGYVEVVLTSIAAAALAQWLDEDPDLKSGFVFPAPNNRQPLDTRIIGKRLVIYGKRCGVENAHPHRFRATFITAAFDAGVPLNEAQAAAHHSDPKSTLRYDRGRRGTGVADTVAAFRKKRETP